MCDLITAPSSEWYNRTNVHKEIIIIKARKSRSQNNNCTVKNKKRISNQNWSTVKLQSKVFFADCALHALSLHPRTLHTLYACFELLGYTFTGHGVHTWVKGCHMYTHIQDYRTAGSSFRLLLYYHVLSHFVYDMMGTHCVYDMTGTHFVYNTTGTHFLLRQ